MKVVRIEQKVDLKKKVDKGVREKKIFEDDKECVFGSLKDLKIKDLKFEFGKYFRKVIKDNLGNNEYVKVEKKVVKDLVVKDKLKIVVFLKLVDNVVKLKKGKLKVVDKNLEEMNK